LTRVLGTSSTSVLIGGEVPALAKAGVPHSFVVEFGPDFKRRWFLDSTLVSLHSDVAGDGGFLFVCADGATYSTQGGELRELRIADDLSGPNATGMLTSAGQVDQSIVAVGTSRVTYVRQSRGHWLKLSADIECARAEGRGVGFNAVASAAPGEICCAGLRGEVWMWRNEAWNRCDAPTNCDLTCVSVNPDGEYVIGGTRGILMRGSADKWQILESGPAMQSITAISAFQGEMYVADGSRLMKITGDVLEDVGITSGGSIPVRHLSSSGDALWAASRKQVFALQAGSWFELPLRSPEKDGGSARPMSASN
jgi:hypothetical protein